VHNKRFAFFYLLHKTHKNITKVIRKLRKPLNRLLTNDRKIEQGCFNEFLSTLWPRGLKRRFMTAIAEIECFWGCKILILPKFCLNFTQTNRIYPNVINFAQKSFARRCGCIPSSYTPPTTALIVWCEFTSWKQRYGSCCPQVIPNINFLAQLRIVIAKIDLRDLDAIKLSQRKNVETEALWRKLGNELKGVWHSRSWKQKQHNLIASTNSHLEEVRFLWKQKRTRKHMAFWGAGSGSNKNPVASTFLPQSCHV